MAINLTVKQFDELRENWKLTLENGVELTLTQSGRILADCAEYVKIIIESIF